MRYSVLAPGKKMRPVLVVLASAACGGAEADAWPAACAVEMIHAYSLIHDDLPAMDDDDLRRGQPTCHKKFGEALAILAGDALQTLAFETLAGGYPPATAAACCMELAQAAGPAGMVGGQVDDLAWENAGGHGRADRRGPRKAALAQDGALIRASLRLGVLAAHARPGAAAAGAPGAVRRRMAAVSAWPSRSPTICSTSRATPTRPASACGRTPPAAS